MTQMTVAARLLQLARELQVDYIFTNLGSDHPAFIQAFAALDAQSAMPQVICCPHEMTALSAAHGHAMISGRPQMVLVHVDVGTQNLGCSVHNAARAGIPAIVVAGLSPLRQDGDHPGDRTEFIHYGQDAPDQAAIVRQYMKWCYELRAADTVDEVLSRAHQLASTPPCGPVYLTGAREIWEEAAAPKALKPPRPARLGGLPADACDELVDALRRARRPLLLTSSLGRRPEAVDALVRLAEQARLAVAEVSPQCMNFPGDHPCHVGYERNRHVDQADLVICIDTDTPWLPKSVRPAADTPVYLIDAEPLNPRIGLWSFPLDGAFQADGLLVLRQLDEALAAAGPLPDALLAAREDWLTGARQAVQPATPPASEAITPASLSESLRPLIDEDVIVVVEAPSSMKEILPRLRMNRPQSLFLSGASGLGWGINAGIGAKLACPEKTLINLVGDGCFFFGVPSSAYWVARQYEAPALTIIYNNGGWNSPKFSTDLVHDRAQGAGAADRYWVTIGSEARLEQVAAAAGDAAAYAVSAPAELPAVLAEAMAVVRGGRSAVVNVSLPPISGQVLGRQREGARS